MDLKANVQASNPNKVFKGYIVTQLILKINDLAFDPEKIQQYILAVDQLRRNMKSYWGVPTYKEAYARINAEHEKRISELPLGKNGSPDPGVVEQLEYMRARELFAELDELVDATSGERIMLDEIGSPEQMMDDNQIVEIMEDDNK